MKKITSLLLLMTVAFVSAQNSTSYWQQHVSYKMDVDVDVEKFQYSGTQELVYTNNSPNELSQVFYHMYFNAFQPDSEMDARLQAIPDPDRRMVDNKGTKNAPIYESRIAKLAPSEIGYMRATSLKQDGKYVTYSLQGTVLEVQLNEPIAPGASVTFEMEFEGQLPVHIRRAGRNSEDGVAMSMAQWYPKMAEYDFEGWHAHPYIAREFHGVWGDFDVTLHIDRDYTVGGTGVLTNPENVGHGYVAPGGKLELPKGEKLTWNFKAEKVHDFTWAADPEYAHDVRKTASGVTLHFFYKDTDEYRESWKEVQSYTEQALDYFNENIGPYPWPQYSVIQGGDGGMEYAMCTLVAGGKTLRSIVGTVFHEFAHAWFQHLLATNESKHSWMDEGFTSYISGLAATKILRGAEDKPSSGSYRGYYYLVNAGIAESLAVHADRFNTNAAFGTGSYTKGSMVLTQLNYIVGAENVKNILKEYYNEWKFKHPTPNDFKRVAERVSGLQLDWFLNEWTQTNHTIDYAVAEVEGNEVTLARVGRMPMPIDLDVTYADGTKESFNIPLRMMRGEKPTTATILPDWTWAHPKYTFNTSKEVVGVRLNPNGLMADINKENDTYSK